MAGGDLFEESSFKVSQFYFHHSGSTASVKPRNVVAAEPQAHIPKFELKRIYFRICIEIYYLNTNKFQHA